MALAINFSESSVTEQIDTKVLCIFDILILHIYIYMFVSLFFSVRISLFMHLLNIHMDEHIAEHAKPRA